MVELAKRSCVGLVEPLVSGPRLVRLCSMIERTSVQKEDCREDQGEHDERSELGRSENVVKVLQDVLTL